MRAVLLFSAVMHIAALGLVVAAALRSWLDTRRVNEVSFPQTMGVAAGLGAAVTVAATILMWLARPFGPALVTGVLAGLLAAFAFLLALGAWPHRAADGSAMTWHVRMGVLAAVGVFVAVELVAFCFLAAASGTVRA